MWRQQHGVENWLAVGGLWVGGGCRLPTLGESTVTAESESTDEQMTFEKKCCLRGQVLFSLTCRLYFQTGLKSNPEPGAGILRAWQITCVFEACVILMPTLGWSQPKVTVHT